MSNEYKVSPPFKLLLKRFGELTATTHFYAEARAPGPVDRPGENYTLADLADREPAEPALIVKVSADGGSRIDRVVAADGGVDDALRVMELPEDEFWFFEAFRPAFSRLAIGAPGFLFEMAVINLYAVFEAYLADMLRSRLRRLPQLVSAKARRSSIGNDIDPTARLVDRAVEHDIRKITYGSITSLLEQLRTDLHMNGLTTDFDIATQRIALIRNCLLHNGGMADQKLAAADSSFRLGHRLEIAHHDLSASMRTLRGLVLAIDRADQLSRP
jgi:hypothetical protein